MTNSTDETKRHYTVTFRDRDGDVEIWHVLAATPVEGLGRAQAKALQQVWIEGGDSAWRDLALVVVSITERLHAEGHHAELLYREVDPEKDRKAIRAAMRAALDAEGHGDA